MASINYEFFDIIGELILMKEESKEDEEHVRKNKLIEAIEAVIEASSMEECSCEKKNKLIEAMEACSLED
ncbi:hypothetical protein YC2023_024568 [Brassica napus]